MWLYLSMLMRPPRLKFCRHAGHFHLACDEAVRQQHILTDQTVCWSHFGLKKECYSLACLLCKKSRAQHWWMPLNGCIYCFCFFPLLSSIVFSSYTSSLIAGQSCLSSENPDENVCYRNMGLKSLIWLQLPERSLWLLWFDSPNTPHTQYYLQHDLNINC